MIYTLHADLSRANDRIHNGFTDHVEDDCFIHGWITDSSGQVVDEHTSSSLAWLEYDLKRAVGECPDDVFLKEWEHEVCTQK